MDWVDGGEQDEYIDFVRDISGFRCYNQRHCPASAVIRWMLLFVVLLSTVSCQTVSSNAPDVISSSYPVITTSVSPQSSNRDQSLFLSILSSSLFMQTIPTPISSQQIPLDASTSYPASISSSINNSRISNAINSTHALPPNEMTSTALTTSTASTHSSVLYSSLTVTISTSSSRTGAFSPTRLFTSSFSSVASLSSSLNAVVLPSVSSSATLHTRFPMASSLISVHSSLPVLRTPALSTAPTLPAAAPSSISTTTGIRDVIALVSTDFVLPSSAVSTPVNGTLIPVGKKGEATGIKLWMIVALALGALLIIGIALLVICKLVKWNKDHGDYNIWSNDIELQPMTAASEQEKLVGLRDDIDDAGFGRGITTFKSIPHEKETKQNNHSGMDVGSKLEKQSLLDDQLTHTKKQWRSNLADSDASPSRPWSSFGPLRAHVLTYDIPIAVENIYDSVPDCHQQRRWSTSRQKGFSKSEEFVLNDSMGCPPELRKSLTIQQRPLPPRPFDQSRNRCFTLPNRSKLLDMSSGGSTSSSTREDSTNNFGMQLAPNGGHPMSEYPPKDNTQAPHQRRSQWKAAARQGGNMCPSPLTRARSLENGSLTSPDISMAASPRMGIPLSVSANALQALPFQWDRPLPPPPVHKDTNADPIYARPKPTNGHSNMPNPGALPGNGHALISADTNGGMGSCKSLSTDSLYAHIPQRFTHSQGSLLSADQRRQYSPEYEHIPNGHIITPLYDHLTTPDSQVRLKDSKSNPFTPPTYEVLPPAVGELYMAPRSASFGNKDDTKLGHYMDMSPRKARAMSYDNTLETPTEPVYQCPRPLSQFGDLKWRTDDNEFKI